MDMGFEKKIQPQYQRLHHWECYHAQLLAEYRQTAEEGGDVARYEDLFRAADNMPESPYKARIADVLFQMVLNAPQRADYPYAEPSALEEIKKLRKPLGAPVSPPAWSVCMEQKLHGAWMGRICGCLLGKPVEGIHEKELRSLLQASGNYPMHRYVLSTDVEDGMYDTFQFDLRGKCFADTVTCAPSDDDTNYTVLAARIIEKHGTDFTPGDVAQMWSAAQPKGAYCTAERVAFRNLMAGYFPPDSAAYKNPYREWIGAQIRGDYYGYINPGNPGRAAEMAFRDASISHVKNGIYGEMFVAAMLAGAAVQDDIKEIILCGLSQIPASSRLFEAIMQVVEAYEAAVEWDAFVSKLHSRFDEGQEHDWCHTIPNAMIVAAALLYGGGDFGKTVCLAVQAAFDTDCNGATAGSVLGMRNGISGIGAQWTGPVGGELETSIFGVGTVRITDLVRLTMKHTQL